MAEDHGFTDIADFVVLDEDGSVSLPVEGGTRLTENLVGAHFPEYDGYLVLCRFIQADPALFPVKKRHAEGRHFVRKLSPLCFCSQPV